MSPADDDNDVLNVLHERVLAGDAEALRAVMQGAYKSKTNVWYARLVIYLLAQYYVSANMWLLRRVCDVLEDVLRDVKGDHCASLTDVFCLLSYVDQVPETASMNEMRPETPRFRERLGDLTARIQSYPYAPQLEALRASVTAEGMRIASYLYDRLSMSRCESADADVVVLVKYFAGRYKRRVGTLSCFDVLFHVLYAFAKRTDGDADSPVVDAVVLGYVDAAKDLFFYKNTVSGGMSRLNLFFHAYFCVCDNRVESQAMDAGRPVPTKRTDYLFLLRDK